MYKIMTPGPTQVAENVRLARSLECTNPDLDEDFVEFYKETCEKISALLHTSNETLILSGEGILGLEAAIASMTEPGDKVLVLDNGIYGKGFADFVSMYGGKPELYTRDYRNTLDVKELEDFLADNHDYKYATVVHGDTPSGMLNDVAAICPLLKKYGIRITYTIEYLQGFIYLPVVHRILKFHVFMLLVKLCFFRRTTEH